MAEPLCAECQEGNGPSTRLTKNYFNGILRLVSLVLNLSAWNGDLLLTGLWLLPLARRSRALVSIYGKFIAELENAERQWCENS